VLVGAGLVTLGRRVRRRVAQREQSQAVHAGRALGDARQALAASELRGVASSVERAIYNAIEWATGLKLRAVLRSDLERTLKATSLGSELAARAVELLDRAGQLRLGQADPAQASALIADADVLVKRLVRRPPARLPALSGEEARS
jgi:hypothetical protein